MQINNSLNKMLQKLYFGIPVVKVSVDINKNTDKLIIDSLKAVSMIT